MSLIFYIFFSLLSITTSFIKFLIYSLHRLFSFILKQIILLIIILIKNDDNNLEIHGSLLLSCLYLDVIYRWSFCSFKSKYFAANKTTTNKPATWERVHTNSARPLQNLFRNLKTIESLKYGWIPFTCTYLQVST